VGYVSTEALTAEVWRRDLMHLLDRRLQKTWGPDVVQSLVQSQPHLADGDNLSIFKRKWEYMYVYAEIGFARGYTGLHHFTFVRPSVELGDDVLTRCD
jgi:cyclopropane-fatty-acyl-phospholipid synthase